MIHKKIFIFSFFFIFFCSCNYEQEVSGIVIDSKTREPIDSVYVYRYGKIYNNCYTNTRGYFEIKDVSGIPIGNNSLKVVFEKDNFERKIVKFKRNEHKKVVLENY